MIVGVIGGIGSGKSLVTDFLRESGKFSVLQTDEIAAALMNGDPELKQQLKKQFGGSIFDESGKLNKKNYAALIYSDSENRKQSDRIVHPAVWKKTRELIRELSAPGNPENIVIETALPGPEFRNLCDRIVLVSANEEIRVRRLMENRGYSEEYAGSVLRQQPSAENYKQYADHVLMNNGTSEELRKEVRKLL